MNERFFLEKNLPASQEFVHNGTMFTRSKSSTLQLDRYRDRLFLLDLSLAILPFAFLFGVFLHEPRMKFESAVTIGMSKDQVIAAVGVPNRKLDSGEMLSKERDANYKVVTNETWIYYVGGWEFKLTFQDNRIAEIKVTGS